MAHWEPSTLGDPGQGSDLDRECDAQDLYTAITALGSSASPTWGSAVVVASMVSRCNSAPTPLPAAPDLVLGRLSPLAQAI